MSDEPIRFTVTPAAGLPPMKPGDQEPITFTVTPQVDPPPMKAGDKVTWMDDDGVAELYVVQAEPWEDEDGSKGQSIRFAPQPPEPSNGT